MSTNKTNILSSVIKGITSLCNFRKHLYYQQVQLTYKPQVVGTIITQLLIIPVASGSQKRLRTDIDFNETFSK